MEAFGNITQCLPWANVGLQQPMLALTCLISQTPSSGAQAELKCFPTHVFAQLVSLNRNLQYTPITS